ncbi:MAG TPA: L,D-transpeptidase family protein [Gemmatimonadaceae bacterium]
MTTRRKKTMRLRTATAAILFVLAIACDGGKGGRASGDVSRNWTPPRLESLLGVKAADAKAAIQARLAGKPPAPIPEEGWKHVQTLYEEFDQSLLWLDDKGVEQPRVGALLRALASADSDALRLDAYPLAELSRALQAVDQKHPTAQQLADADVLLSSAYAAFGEDMLTGQRKPSALGQAWHINPLEERVDSALALTLREDDLAAGLARMRPQDPGYDSLRAELGRYRELAAKGGWARVPAGGGRIAALRARLAVEGISVSSGGRSLERRLAGAIAEFQARHGIVVDSILGQETLDALNVPVEYRVAQIASNLERYRWMPRSLGSRYILVNVPQFKLTAFDSGVKALEMKVIVGKDYADRATPVFSDSMEYVIFRPYWNVTPTIAAKEIFPREAESPGYIAALDMEVYNDHGRTAVRQRPGPKNALGFVKFMFPNDFNIYLHDTPNHELFNKDIRAFSHGCIRIEKPDQLAQWVLGWTPDRVTSAMHGANNNEVTLPTKIPVYIVYFTTMVEDGRLQFGNDLYDRDNRLVIETKDAALPTPEILEAQRALRELAERSG